MWPSAFARLSGRTVDDVSTLGRIPEVMLPLVWHLRVTSFMKAVECRTLEWVDWVNHQRLLEPRGNIPPAKAEAYQYAAFESLKVVA